MIKEIDFNFPIIFYIENVSKVMEEYIVIEQGTEEFNNFKSVLINDLQLQDLIFNIGLMQSVHEDLEGNVKWLSFFTMDKLMPFLEVYKDETFFKKNNLLLSKIPKDIMLHIEFGKVKK